MRTATPGAYDLTRIGSTAVATPFGSNTRGCLQGAAPLQASKYRTPTPSDNSVRVGQPLMTVCTAPRQPRRQIMIGVGQTPSSPRQGQMLHTFNVFRRRFGHAEDLWVMVVVSVILARPVCTFYVAPCMDKRPCTLPYCEITTIYQMKSSAFQMCHQYY